MLLVGSPKCKAFTDLRSMDRRDPKFSKTLEAGLSHLKSLMKIYGWQNGHGRWMVSARVILITAGVRTPRRCEPWNHCLEFRVTKTKHFGAIMINCSPIVEELDSSSTNPGESPVLFATSVFARPATDIGRSYCRHRQHRSWTDCGGGLPCAED